MMPVAFRLRSTAARLRHSRGAMSDIFKFWSRIKRGSRIHPDDAEVFGRLGAEKHGFDLRCLPAAFGGALKTAKVVLLFASPGLSSQLDLSDANTNEGKDYYMRRWKGREPFRDEGDGSKWLRSIVKRFGEYDDIRHGLAVLNIGAYHSRRVKNWRAVMSLPSSRASLDWAQNVLFPRAESSETVVICMRAATSWGLERGRRYRGTLFAPIVNVQRGYLVRDNPANERIVRIVQERLGRSL